MSSAEQLCLLAVSEPEPEIRHALHTGRAGDEWLNRDLDPHSLDPFFHAQTVARALLRLMPDKPVAKHLLDVTQFTNPYAAQLALLSNQSNTHDGEVEQFNYVMREARATPGQTPHSEQRFLQAATAAGTGNVDGATLRTPNEIYYDEEGEPVFFKKGWGFPLVIALQPTSTNGIEAPPGVIGSLDTKTFARGRKITANTKAYGVRAVRAFLPYRPASFESTHNSTSEAIEALTKQLAIDNLRDAHQEAKAA